MLNANLNLPSGVQRCSSQPTEYIKHAPVELKSFLLLSRQFRCFLHTIAFSYFLLLGKFFAIKKPLAVPPAHTRS